MQRILLATFADRDNAEDAIGLLKDNGYNPKDMSIIMRDTHAREEIADNTGANTAEGAVGGAATGAAVGGIAGLVASYAIPTLGAFFIGGPIAAALGLTGAAAAAVSGAATGAVAGGFLGALMGLGLSEDEARIYEDQIKTGAILVAVPLADGADADEARDIMRDAEAENIKVISNNDTSRRHAHMSA